jgi:hypothetical protein
MGPGKVKKQSLKTRFSGDPEKPDAVNLQAYSMKPISPTPSRK